MTCLNLNGYAKGCDESVGGIAKVVLFEAADVSSYTIDASGAMATLVLSEAGDAFAYDYLRDNAKFSDAIIGAGTVSTVSFQPTVTLAFKKISLEIINEVSELAKNYTVAIVETNNGDAFTLGIERGLSLIASAGFDTGLNFEEANGVNIVLQGNERRPIIPTDISGTSPIDAKILALFGN